MTKQLRKRIMIILMLLLSATFIAIIIAINLGMHGGSRNMANESLNILMQKETGPGNMPGMMPGDKPDFSAAKSSDNANNEHDKQTNEDDKDAPPSFPTDKGMALAVAHHITVRYTKDKELKSIDNTLSDSYTDEDITAYCEKILTADKKEGTIDQLRYMMRENGDEITIVFIDHSSAVRTGKNLLIISIIACILAIFIFALISYFLSGWLVRPVEEAFNKQKQFISDASHELKTPITVILSNSELLEDSIGENKQLSYIKDECDRMHQLVTSLLTLTHLEQTPYEEITKNDFDMSNTVLERVLPMESVAFEKGIMMNYEGIAPDITLHGVKEQIGQVVAILIDNAITHTDKDGKIEVKLRKTPHHIHLTVANTGKEIPQEEREKLFERFYRADEARHRASGHFGLGLSIAKTIVTNHKGKIGVECADGITTFTVSIKTAEK